MRREASAALLLVLVLVSLVPSADAHPIVLETTPAQSSSNAPLGTTQVIVIYSEALEMGFSTIKVFDSHGNQIDNRDTNYYGNEKSLVVTVPPLEEGVYTVASKVLSKVDGHLVPYTFSFGVGDATVTDTVPDDSELILYPEAATRFPGLVGQTIIVGAAISAILVWGTQRKDIIKPKGHQVESTLYHKFMSAVGIGLLLVFASNLLMLALQAARLESSVLVVLETSFGTTWVIRMGATVALLVTWFMLSKGRPAWYPKSYAPILALSLILISTSTMIGHGTASGQAAAAVLDYVHNLVAATWIGGVFFFTFALLPSLSVLERETKEKMTLALIPKFSIMIVISLGIVAISGPILLWFLESNVNMIIESTYGKLILTKILIGSIMVSMGAYYQFGVQKKAEAGLGSKKINVHRKMRRALWAEFLAGVILLGVVVLLVNGTLPSGEVHPADAQPANYGLTTVEFSESARFEIGIFPFSVGNNEVTVRMTDPQGNPIRDLEAVGVKVSNPERNIVPVEIEMTKVQGDGSDEFVGDITFGFSGDWVVDMEAQKNETANESVSLDLLIKPRLENLRAEPKEYELPDGGGQPLRIIHDGSGALWLSDVSQPVLWRFTVADGEFESFGFDGNGSQGLAMDGDGKIWFTDMANQRIGYLDPATSETGVIDLPSMAPHELPSQPISLVVDGDDNIWTTVITKGTILKYNQDSADFEIYALDPQSFPFAVIEDDRGRIWYSESATGRIGYIDPDTGEISRVQTDFVIQGPEAFAFDRDGNLWITEHNEAGIVKHNTALGTFERIPVTAADSLPFGMAFDRYGNLWFAQHQIDLIGVYDPHNNMLMDISVPTPGSFVQFLASDHEGNIWFAEEKAGKIGVIRIVEMPPADHPSIDAAGPTLQYTEVASPLVSMVLVGASLAFVKAVRDKRRINEKIFGS